MVSPRMTYDKGVAKSEQRYVVHLVAMALRQLELDIDLAVHHPCLPVTRPTAKGFEAA